jgi:GT2 family glycosyltransferase
MATAVLDVDLEKLPHVISGLERYSRALILVRSYGRPIGQVVLKTVAGRIESNELLDTLMSKADCPFWERWLHSYLGWEDVRATNAAPTAATVAICTRDRPEDLRKCLEALHGLPDDGQELLVVDNCPSNDSTRHSVEQFSGVRYVREDQLGLNNARNRALQEARHEIVAFADDDTRPDPDWLRALVRNFGDPLVMCVTGLTMPLELETEAQEWFERYSPFGRGFNRIIFDSVKFPPAAAGRVGAGANMALRRRVLDLVGAFDGALDAGTPTCSGGDTEMFSRILATGYRIIYEPQALNWHRHRSTWSDLRKTIYGYGVGVYAAMTRSLLVRGDLNVLKVAGTWFLFYQLPTLGRSLLRLPGSTPIDLLFAELWGCAVGPRAYLSSCKRLHTGREA